MSVAGFSRHKHLDELDEPLQTGEGWLTPAQRRARVVANLGITATAAELNYLDITARGDVENGKALVAGDADDTVATLDFSGITLADGANVIRGAALDFEDVTGWIVFSGNTEDDAFRYSAYFQPQTSASGKLLGIGNTGILQSGANVNVAEAAQLHLIVQSGATAGDRAADPTAGFHPVWAKVQGDVGSTWEAGVRVAPIWADLQINGSDVSGDESYMALLTTGSNINSVFRFESGGANATRFLSADKAVGSGMAPTSGYATTQSNDPDAYLVADFNGTLYGIPLMAAS